jgi:hypothetical protein
MGWERDWGSSAAVWMDVIEDRSVAVLAQDITIVMDGCSDGSSDPPAGSSVTSRASTSSPNSGTSAAADPSRGRKTTDGSGLRPVFARRVSRG